MSTSPVLTKLAWDSCEFGFPVSRITGKVTSQLELHQVLRRARTEGVRLLYWFSSPEAPVTDSLLAEFGGALVARKAVFERSDTAAQYVTASPGEPRLIVREHPVSTASADLQKLSLEAGLESRFRLDPRFPRAIFEQLYYTWINRSTLHEVADAVFIAEAAHAKLVGFVTVAVQSDRAVLGLIAVVEAMRGLGVGGALLRAAHQWASEQGIRTVEVVTQLDNRPACSFYERQGYQRTRVEHVYHFWPQSPYSPIP